MNDSTKDNDCLNLENNNKFCFFKVANAFLLLFVFLLTMVLAIYAPRVIKDHNLGFDYMGVIVAVLAILVTTLIGWQIWQTVDMKQKVKSLNDEVAQLRIDASVEIAKARSLSIAFITIHEANQKWEIDKNAVDAYSLICVAVLSLVNINDPKDIARLGECCDALEEYLNILRGETNEDVKNAFLIADKNISQLYTSLQGLSPKLNYTEEIKTRVIRLHKDRKDLLKHWGFVRKQPKPSMPYN